jgi:hypothetical protein
MRVCHYKTRLRGLRQLPPPDRDRNSRKVSERPHSQGLTWFPKMIDPRQTGWWAGNRLTEIALAGSGLRGAGVGLHVVLHAFAGQELVWYSTLYGDQQDNVLLVAVDRATAGSLEKLPANRLRQTDAHADHPDVEEYALSDEIAARLGVRWGDSGYSVERRDLLRYEVYSHDDCFFFVEPLDDALLRRVIHLILRQHSFYLGAPVDWSRVLDPISETLAQTRAIRLRSNPRRQSLTVNWEPTATSFLGKVLRRRLSREVRIDNGRAHFAGVNESAGN